MKIVYLECLLMGNGEVIHLGKTLGYVETALSEKKQMDVIFLRS